MNGHRVPAPNAVCTCSHTFGEHSALGGACDVRWCLCLTFAEKPLALEQAEEAVLCPACLGDLTTRNVATGEAAKPEDLVICRWCAAMLEIDENGKPQRMSIATMKELSEQEPKIYRKMMAVKKRILQSIEMRAKPVVN